jgi:hypothetical protein
VRTWLTTDSQVLSLKGIRRVAISKDNDKLQKFGLYLSMYKEIWKRAVMKYDEE